MQPLEEQEIELTAMPLDWHVFRYSKKKSRSFGLPLQLGWGEPVPLPQIESEAESLAEKITKEFGKGTYCAFAYPRQRVSLVGAIPLLIQYVIVTDRSARYVLIRAKLREFVGEKKLFPSWQDLTPMNLANNLWLIAVKSKTQAASQSASEPASEAGRQPELPTNRNPEYDQVEKLKATGKYTTRKALIKIQPGFPKLSKDDQRKAVDAANAALRQRRKTEKEKASQEGEPVLEVEKKQQTSLVSHPLT